MTVATAWIAERSPLPPPELAERIEEAIVRTDVTDRPLADALARAGRAEAEAAVARPGRVRESAFRLLVADALITYACEAALESEAPEEALRAVLEIAVGR